MKTDKNYVKKTNKDKLRERYQPKPEFVERIEKLMGKEDAKKFFEISYFACPDIVRVNTLKISPEKLKKKLEEKGWIIEQPYPQWPEVFLIKKESNLKPGDLGKTTEHLLGYYYVQEISSMLPVLTLAPTENDLYLDLCASPGSKTTQAAAIMNNSGTIIANEVSLGRVKILNANLEKCGVSNTLVIRKDGVQFCKRWSKEIKTEFDKILVDAPCSGEGTLRKSPKTFDMWNLKFINALSSVQKKLASEALKILKVGGEMIYSTCTLSPEEDEFIVNYLKKNFDIEVMKVELPLKTRNGVTEWEGEILDEEIKNCVRVYPQDNNSDGFFLAKIKKLSDKCLLVEEDRFDKFQKKYEDEAEELKMEVDDEEMGDEQDG
ncbi:RsmB/NOP family class I SAM-dependent RNA methyltransferase [Candidatus Pacearchaeota archaeon]|nr:RsmB/NOP family class I SAM-dependent RNA methyltransferase [Candidatus Pacearchaeota archaeon]